MLIHTIEWIIIDTTEQSKCTTTDDDDPARIDDDDDVNASPPPTNRNENADGDDDATAVADAPVDEVSTPRMLLHILPDPMFGARVTSYTFTTSLMYFRLQGSDDAID